MFDDDDDATQFDPNPWGARQRVIPRETFRAAPVAPASIVDRPSRESIAPAFGPAFVPAFAGPSFAPAYAGPGFAPAPITLRLPAWPVQPRRWLARYAISLCGAVALVLLAIAYALKPATVEPAPAAAIAMPAAEELAMQVEAVATDSPAPAIALPAIDRPAAKPRAKVKRRPIKIDASITSTPLGHLRPSRR